MAPHISSQPLTESNWTAATTAVGAPVRALQHAACGGSVLRAVDGLRCERCGRTLVDPRELQPHSPERPRRRLRLEDLKTEAES